MDHDFCNNDGARRLKQRIEEYWRERGYKVDVKLIEAGFVGGMRSARMDVSLAPKPGSSDSSDAYTLT